MRLPEVPPEVRTMLSGPPDAGTWDAMFPLLTVDEAGFPHVCLLSSAELEVGRREIRVVLASRGTIANISRTRKATLIAVGADTAFYLKLSVSRSTPDRDWLAVACAVASVKEDSLQIALQPPRYLVAPGLSLVRRLGARRPSPEPTAQDS